MQNWVWSYYAVLKIRSNEEFVCHEQTVMTRVAGDLQSSRRRNSGGRRLVLQTLGVLYLRNRKHVLCFYQVIKTRLEVWENEKCCGNTSCRRVFPQLFQVLPNFQECFYLTIRLWARDFYEVIFDSACGSCSHSIVLVENLRFDNQNYQVVFLFLVAVFPKRNRKQVLRIPIEV